LHGHVTIFGQGLALMGLVFIDTGGGFRATPIVPVRKDPKRPLAFDVRLQEPERNPHVGLRFHDASLSCVAPEVYWLVQFNEGLMVADRRSNLVQANPERKCGSSVALPFIEAPWIVVPVLELSVARVVEAIQVLRDMVGIGIEVLLLSLDCNMTADEQDQGQRRATNVEVRPIHCEVPSVSGCRSRGSIDYCASTRS
jgi:hypothetical protein